MPNPPGRTHLIGLDRPALNANLPLRGQATVHEQHRLESVAETLALTALIAAKKVLSGHEIVTVRGAEFQWGEGQAGEGTVGAHCLPGQLQFNGSPIHSMPNWTDRFVDEHGLKPLALSSKLRNVSARTDVVPQVVNQTDNLIEKMAGGRGLKTRFGGTVHQLLDWSLFQPSQTSAALGQAVLTGMEHYRVGASYACEERLDWLRQQIGFAVSDAEHAKRQQQTLVTEEYLRVLQDRSFVPFPATMSGIQEIVLDVVKR